MKKFIVLSIFGLVIALAGCGDSPNSVQSVALNPSVVQGSPEDRAAVLAEATRHPEFMDDGFYSSSVPMTNQIPSVDGGLSAQAAIEPVTFWRRIRESERQFDVEFADADSTGRPTTAILTVHKDLTGTFNILATDTTESFNPPFEVRKPLSERWTRRLQFHRAPGDGDGGGDDDDDGGGDNGGGDDDDEGDDDDDGGKGDDDDDEGDDDDDGGKGGGKGDDDDDGGRRDDDDEGDDDDDDGDRARGVKRNAPTHGRGNGDGGGGLGGWELAEVSGIEVSSDNLETQIVSVTLQTPGGDITITDVLELIPVDELPELAPGSEITITATTQASDDIVLLISRDRRVRLQPNGDNTYTGTFIVPQSFGSHHFGVNALSHDTLYDDTAPYDSETWILPIRAGSGALARAR